MIIFIRIETGVTFINIKASNLFEKYIGESEKIVAAVFSLARKLAPSVIFIDEIDTILFNRNQSSNAHAAYSSTLGLFLSEWDGLTASPEALPVVVLGATNRPQDIDEAFRRRMPVSIETKAPNLDGRRDILSKILSSDALDIDVSLHEIAIRSEGMTGSDLRELCRSANTVRARELIMKFKDMQNDKLNGESAVVLSNPSENGVTRALCMNDFNIALSKMVASGKVIQDFGYFDFMHAIS
jgi:ATPase family AAA domain-containing protein 1